MSIPWSVGSSAIEESCEVTVRAREAGAEEVVRCALSAITACGYSQRNVAEWMIEIGEEHTTENTVNE